jgi:Flp pilus assembly protein TadG
MDQGTARAVRRRFRRHVAALPGNETGTAAVEFALVGLSFTLALFFILEVGAAMAVQTTLDEATRVASRLIRTGAVTSTGATTFVASLCAHLPLLPNCSSTIQYNVVSGSSFASLSTAIVTNNSNQMTGTKFSPGSTGQDVVVQVGWALPVVGSLLGKNGSVLLVSTVAFQNEPF